jgi:magnesium chelatase family protein
MLACVLSCAILGLDGAMVHTELDVTNGLPSFIVVGLPDTAVQESRERVQAARERQRERFTGTDLAANADMRPAEVRRFCKLDEAGTALLRTAMAQLQLTARSFQRVLKIARTIADLSGAEVIRPAHRAEALQYRPRQVG